MAAGVSRTAGLGHLLPKSFGIVGAGQVGTGIAELACIMGLGNIVLLDQRTEALKQAQGRIHSRFSRAVKAKQWSEADARRALSQVKYTSTFPDLAEVDFVSEAVNEDEVLKKHVFRRLDEVCHPEAVLSSNTTSLSITRIGSVTKRPEKVIGMRFMHPPTDNKFLEVIGGKGTSDYAFDRAQALAITLGKTVCFSADRPGFIVNRLVMPMLNEAFFALMEGVASAEDIDTAMELGMGQGRGPLKWADYIGLDTCLSTMRMLHSGLGDDKYRPCPLLVQYVDAGWLGVKSRRGVFLYPDGRASSAIYPGVAASSSTGQSMGPFVR